MAGIVGAFALLLIVIGLFAAPRQTGISLLTMWAAGLTLVQGALILLMIGAVTHARWLEPWVPILMRMTRAFPAFAVVLVPILLVERHLYPWAGSAIHLTPGESGQIRSVGAWFGSGFFLARAVVYFATWILFAGLFRRGPAERRRAISAVGLIVVGVTQTFAAFDWLMSLTAQWYSTIYGIYYFAGGLLAALGLLAILAERADRGRPVDHQTALIHYRSLGLMLLTMVIFWAYIAFAQLLIIWIADVPREIIWYLPRIRGSWGGVGLVLLIGHFIIPLLMLLSSEIKRDPRRLARLGAWLLLMHLVDIYWLVEPAASPSAAPHWQDFVALLFICMVMTLSYGGPARSAGPFLSVPETGPRPPRSGNSRAAGERGGTVLPA